MFQKRMSSERALNPRRSEGMTFFDCTDKIIRPTFERIKSDLESQNKNIVGQIIEDGNRCRLDITEMDGEKERRYFRIHFSGHYPEDENLVRMIPLSMLHSKIIIDQDRGRALTLVDISSTLIKSLANILMESIGMKA
jgi:hypothetical protein